MCEGLFFCSGFCIFPQAFFSAIFSYKYDYRPAFRDVNAGLHRFGLELEKSDICH